MKYQHYEKYAAAAENLLPNLPEIFTAKEFDAMRNPLRAAVEDKIENEIRPKFWNIRPEYSWYGEGRKAYEEWHKMFCHEMTEAKESIPISLQALRAHNFVVTDHQEPITITVEIDPWRPPTTTFYYDGEEVSEKIYNKMKKYEPEKCSMQCGEKIDAYRNYYRVDWDALNEYLYGENAAEGYRILEEIEQLETTLAELRKRRKVECPDWDD